MIAVKKTDFCGQIDQINKVLLIFKKDFKEAQRFFINMTNVTSYHRPKIPKRSPKVLIVSTTIRNIRVENVSKFQNLSLKYRKKLNAIWPIDLTRGSKIKTKKIVFQYSIPYITERSRLFSWIFTLTVQFEKR